jgi:hypothetical protein
MGGTLLETVKLRVENRQGTLYVSSTDVPGLYLWGDDPEDVFGAVIPTIEALYKHNRDLTVEARRSSEGDADRWRTVETEPTEVQIFIKASREQSQANG